MAGINASRKALPNSKHRQITWHAHSRCRWLQVILGAQVGRIYADLTRFLLLHAPAGHIAAPVDLAPGAVMLCCSVECCDALAAAWRVLQFWREVSKRIFSAVLHPCGAFLRSASAVMRIRISVCGRV